MAEYRRSDRPADEPDKKHGKGLEHTD